MRLAGDHDLDRQREQPLDVGEDEPGALVGREAAGEADRQAVAVDAGALGQARLRRGVDAPDRLGADSVPRRTPVRLVGRRLGVDTPVPQQLAERGIEPGADVHAVRDVTDRRLLAGPERRPHLARHLAVQIRDAVRVRGQPERERRHPEAGLVAETSELEQRLPVEAGGLGQLADVAHDEVLVELLVTGRDGRVRREDRRPAHMLEGVCRLHPLRRELAQPFDLQEGRVALVQVEDVRLDPERRERADTADAEQELLADPVLAVAAVERVREPLHLEQVERHRTDVLSPDGCLDRLVRELDRHRHRLTHQADRVRVDPLVVLGLPAVRVDLLPEVAAAVEQSDSHERDAELGCGLQMVAGEDPEAARVDRQPLVQPELHAEVRDEEVLVATGALPPADGVCGRVRHRPGNYLARRLARRTMLR